MNMELFVLTGTEDMFLNKSWNFHGNGIFLIFFISVSDWQRAGEMRNPADEFAQTDV